MSNYWRNISHQSSIKNTVLFSIVAVVTGFLVIPLFVNNKTVKNLPMNSIKTAQPLKYVSLGDSYTVGANEQAKDSFPSQLVSALNKGGINATLVANPAVSGYTTQDLIDDELQVFNKYEVNFATLLIGANDIAQRVDETTYRKNLVYILDNMLQKIQDKKGIIVLTIPDFSITPVAKRQGMGEPVQETIEKFNKIIKEESTKRDLKVVDLYNITKEMETDKSLINADGLHPTAKEYSKWVELLLPEVKKIK